MDKFMERGVITIDVDGVPRLTKIDTSKLLTPTEIDEIETLHGRAVDNYEEFLKCKREIETFKNGNSLSKYNGSWQIFSVEATAALDSVKNSLSDLEYQADLAVKKAIELEILALSVIGDRPIEPLQSNLIFSIIGFAKSQSLILAQEYARLYATWTTLPVKTIEFLQNVMTPPVNV